MKKFLFKILCRFFQDQIIDTFIEERLPLYNIDRNDTKILEQLADLYESPGFKLFVSILSNKKNYLARKALNLKYTTLEQAGIQLTHLKGQSFDIAHILKTMKFFNKVYKKRSTKKEQEIIEEGNIDE